MTFFARFFRLVWGGEVDRALRPVLAVALAGSIAGSSLFTFMGIWAIQELGASGRSLGATFLVGAVLAAASGYLGGHLSDHFGRRRLILFGWAGWVVYIPFFLVVGDNLWLGLGLLMGIGLSGPPTKRWSPTSCHPRSTRRRTPRCGSPRTSASRWARPAAAR